MELKEECASVKPTPFAGWHTNTSVTTTTMKASISDSRFAVFLATFSLLIFFVLHTAVYLVSLYYPGCSLPQLQGSRFDFRIAIPAPAVALVIDGTIWMFAIGAWAKHVATLSCTLHVCMLLNYAILLSDTLSPVYLVDGRYIFTARYVTW